MRVHSFGGVKIGGKTVITKNNHESTAFRITCSVVDDAFCDLIVVKGQLRSPTALPDPFSPMEPIQRIVLTLTYHMEDTVTPYRVARYVHG